MKSFLNRMVELLLGERQRERGRDINQKRKRKRETKKKKKEKERDKKEKESIIKRVSWFKSSLLLSIKTVDITNINS